MANHARIVELADEERAELEALLRSPKAASGLVRRARAVLLMADGESGAEVARLTGYTPVQISRIRRRFVEQRIAGLATKPRSGRPKIYDVEKTAEIVALTLQPPGEGLTHWSTRELAGKVGVSHATVHRVWRAHDLQPHRVQTFKFSRDPRARGEDLRRRRPLPQPPDECGRPQRGREDARSRPSTGHSRCCRFGPGSPHGKPMTTGATASRASTRLWRWRPARSSASAHRRTAARTSCASSSGWPAPILAGSFT